MLDTKSGTSSNNFDNAEIAKFNALASRWWDKNSEFKPLHDINPLRANYIDQHASVAGKTVLDIGCGGGILAEALAQRGAKVAGIDMGEAPLTVAKLHALENKLDIDYQKSTAEDFVQNQTQQFDIVTCLEMLEHVPDPAQTISACAALCKPGGHLFFSTINRNPKAFALAIVGAEYILGLLPRGTHEYGKFIKPSELARWLRASDLQLKHSTGMTYNPLNKNYRLNPSDMSVNYLMHACKAE